MPQAQLDTQEPLSRRKALVARLMAQMNRASFSGGRMGGGVGITGSHLNPAGRFVAPSMPVVPANPSIPAPANPPPFIQPQTPAAPEPTTQGIEPPPVAAPAPEPWQSQGYVSAAAMQEFEGLDEGTQTRILANPVARRRFFA